MSARKNFIFMSVEMSIKAESPVKLRWTKLAPETADTSVPHEKGKVQDVVKSEGNVMSSNECC